MTQCLKPLPNLDKTILVWIKDFSASPSRFALLKSYLSPSETKRAQNYKTKKLQRNFIIARGSLRQLLADYLNIEPQLVKFTYNEFGKPLLQEETPHFLHFNLSHSHNRFAIVLSRNKRVGIDIEHVVSSTVNLDLVKAIFSSHELQQYHDLPDSLKIEGFFRSWTLKEAYVKAMGVGLNCDFRKIEIPLDLQRRCISLNQWKLFVLPPENRWAGALAIESCQITSCEKSTEKISFTKYVNDCLQKFVVQI